MFIRALAGFVFFIDVPSTVVFSSLSCIMLLLAAVQGLDLPINTFSCTVGLKLSQANYYIKSSLAAAALCKEASLELLEVVS